MSSQRLQADAKRRNPVTTSERLTSVDQTTSSLLASSRNFANRSNGDASQHKRDTVESINREAKNSGSGKSSPSSNGSGNQGGWLANMILAKAKPPDPEPVSETESNETEKGSNNILGRLFSGKSRNSISGSAENSAKQTDQKSEDEEGNGKKGSKKKAEKGKRVLSKAFGLFSKSKEDVTKEDEAFKQEVAKELRQRTQNLGFGVHAREEHDRKKESILTITSTTSSKGHTTKIWLEDQPAGSFEKTSPSASFSSQENLSDSASPPRPDRHNIQSDPEPSSSTMTETKAKLFLNLKKSHQPQPSSSTKKYSSSSKTIGNLPKASNSKASEKRSNHKAADIQHSPNKTSSPRRFSSSLSSLQSGGHSKDGSSKTQISHGSSSQLEVDSEATTPHSHASSGEKSVTFQDTSTKTKSTEHEKLHSPKTEAPVLKPTLVDKGNFVRKVVFYQNRFVILDQAKPGPTKETKGLLINSSVSTSDISTVTSSISNVTASTSNIPVGNSNVLTSIPKKSSSISNLPTSVSNIPAHNDLYTAPYCVYGQMSREIHEVPGSSGGGQRESDPRVPSTKAFGDIRSNPAVTGRFGACAPQGRDGHVSRASNQIHENWDLGIDTGREPGLAGRGRASRNDSSSKTSQMLGADSQRTQKKHFIKGEPERTREKGKGHEEEEGEEGREKWRSEISLSSWTEFLRSRRRQRDNSFDAVMFDHQRLSADDVSNEMQKGQSSHSIDYDRHETLEATVYEDDTERSVSRRKGQEKGGQRPRFERDISRQNPLSSRQGVSTQAVTFLDSHRTKGEDVYENSTPCDDDLYEYTDDNVCPSQNADLLENDQRFRSEMSDLYPDTEITYPQAGSPDLPSPRDSRENTMWTKRGQNVVHDNDNLNNEWAEDISDLQDRVIDDNTFDDEYLPQISSRCLDNKEEAKTVEPDSPDELNITGIENTANVIRERRTFSDLEDIREEVDGYFSDDNVGGLIGDASFNLIHASCSVGLSGIEYDHPRHIDDRGFGNSASMRGKQEDEHFNLKSKSRVQFYSPGQTDVRASIVDKNGQQYRQASRGVSKIRRQSSLPETSSEQEQITHHHHQLQQRRPDHRLQSEHHPYSPSQIESIKDAGAQRHYGRHDYFHIIEDVKTAQPTPQRQRQPLHLQLQEQPRHQQQHEYELQQHDQHERRQQQDKKPQERQLTETQNQQQQRRQQQQHEQQRQGEFKGKSHQPGYQQIRPQEAPDAAECESPDNDRHRHRHQNRQLHHVDNHQQQQQNHHYTRNQHRRLHQDEHHVIIPLGTDRRSHTSIPATHDNATTTSTPATKDKRLHDYYYHSSDRIRADDHIELTASPTHASAFSNRSPPPPSPSPPPHPPPPPHSPSPPLPSPLHRPSSRTIIPNSSNVINLHTRRSPAHTRTSTSSPPAAATTLTAAYSSSHSLLSSSSSPSSSPRLLSGPSLSRIASIESRCESSARDAQGGRKQERIDSENPHNEKNARRIKISQAPAAHADKSNTSFSTSVKRVSSIPKLIHSKSNSFDSIPSEDKKYILRNDFESSNFVSTEVTRQNRRASEKARQNIEVSTKTRQNNNDASQMRRNSKVLRGNDDETSVCDYHGQGHTGPEMRDSIRYEESDALISGKYKVRRQRSPEDSREHYDREADVSETATLSGRYRAHERRYCSNPSLSHVIKESHRDFGDYIGHAIDYDHLHETSRRHGARDHTGQSRDEPHRNHVKHHGSHSESNPQYQSRDRSYESLDNNRGYDSDRQLRHSEELQQASIEHFHDSNRRRSNDLSAKFATGQDEKRINRSQSFSSSPHDHSHSPHRSSITHVSSSSQNPPRGRLVHRSESFHEHDGLNRNNSPHSSGSPRSDRPRRSLQTLRSVSLDDQSQSPCRNQGHVSNIPRERRRSSVGYHSDRADDQSRSPRRDTGYVSNSPRGRSHSSLHSDTTDVQTYSPRRHSEQDPNTPRESSKYSRGHTHHGSESQSISPCRSESHRANSPRDHSYLPRGHLSESSRDHSHSPRAHMHGSKSLRDLSHSPQGRSNEFNRSRDQSHSPRGHKHGSNSPRDQTDSSRGDIYNDRYTGDNTYTSRGSTSTHHSDSDTRRDQSDSPNRQPSYHVESPRGRPHPASDSHSESPRNSSRAPRRHSSTEHVTNIPCGQSNSPRRHSTHHTDSRH